MEKLRCILLSGRSQPEKSTYSDPNCMTFWERHHYGDDRKVSDYGAGVSRWDMDWWGGETSLYDCNGGYTSSYICPDTEFITQRVTPHVTVDFR